MKTQPVVCAIAFICAALTMGTGDIPSCAGSDVKWILHFAGDHAPEVNDCSLEILDCTEICGATEAGLGRYDLYVLAIDVPFGIQETRFGICTEDDFTFYGWTGCGDYEDPSSGWPGNDEGITIYWTSVFFGGPHVTLGILDVYANPPAIIKVCPDPRVGYAEYCETDLASAYCQQATHPVFFGWVGFQQNGYVPCGYDPVPVERGSWGAIKALYRK